MGFSGGGFSGSGRLIIIMKKNAFCNVTTLCMPTMYDIVVCR